LFVTQKIIARCRIEAVEVTDFGMKYDAILFERFFEAELIFVQFFIVETDLGMQNFCFDDAKLASKMQNI
jgi:hypothetical protein